MITDEDKEKQMLQGLSGSKERGASKVGPVRLFEV